jgi:drug/metabolite transporter (DMT)-like permease
LFAALIEPLVFKRKVDLSEILMGIVIVICISLIFKVEFQYKLGIIYGLICALLGTIFSVFNGKIYGKTSSGNIIFYEIFGGWVVISLYFSVFRTYFSSWRNKLQRFSVIDHISEYLLLFQCLNR